MPNRIEARSAKAALTNATGRLPLLRLFSTPLIHAKKSEVKAQTCLVSTIAGAEVYFRVDTPFKVAGQSVRPVAASSTSGNRAVGLPLPQQFAALT